MELSGNLRKMESSAEDTVSYTLPVGEERLALNPLIGSELELRFDGVINCVACGRQTKKSFNQGYCYPCFQRLPECDICIVRPEKCHYDKGTCRDPEWGESHCMQLHYVYLSNTSGLKVGITRGSQIPTRWVDQGASQALPIFRVQTRYQAGLIEVLFKEHIADRTDWRRMLKGEPEPVDLAACRDELFTECTDGIAELQERFGVTAIEPLSDEATVALSFPVQRYPEKVKAHNLDKEPLVKGTLEGIKGQYLIFDTGVLNVRKFGGYRVTVRQ